MNLDIDDAWDGFWRKVGPPGIKTDSIQYIESRRMFYAGLATALNMCREISEEMEDKGDDYAMKQLNYLADQLDEFKKQILKGNA